MAGCADIQLVFLIASYLNRKGIRFFGFCRGSNTPNPLQLRKVNCPDLLISLI